MFIMRSLLLIYMLFAVVACTGKVTSNYPVSPQDARNDRMGKITGKNGVVVSAKDGITVGSKKSSCSSVNINAYLWRAALEMVYFMPISSIDPTSGVIMTDWYKNNPASQERYKVTIFITDENFRVDAVKVTVFKQEHKNGTWIDVQTSLGDEIKDKVIEKARALKIISESEE